MTIEILQELQRASGPVGAKALTDAIAASQATIGRLLRRMEEDGLIAPVSNKGRRLTPEGLKRLREHSASDVKTRIARDLVNISFDGDKERLIEVMRIREMLEPDCAAVAAQRATKEELTLLENYAYGHRYLLFQGRAANKEDLNFHLSIAAISQNQTLSKILELLLTDNNAYVEFSRAGEAERDAQVAAHFEILDAIRSRDGARARSAMCAHLKHVIEDVRRVYRIPEKTDGASEAGARAEARVKGDPGPSAKSDPRPS